MYWGLNPGCPHWVTYWATTLSYFFILRQGLTELLNYPAWAWSSSTPVSAAQYWDYSAPPWLALFCFFLFFFFLFLLSTKDWTCTLCLPGGYYAIKLYLQPLVFHFACKPRYVGFTCSTKSTVINVRCIWALDVKHQFKIGKTRSWVQCWATVNSLGLWSQPSCNGSLV